MADLPFDKVQKIPLKHKDTVFGYIRQCQLLFNSNETYYQLHRFIQYSILLFCFTCIDSKILNNKEIDKLFSLFAKQNKFKELEPFSYHILYASYRDGIGENVFKGLCHGLPNLLCVIETKAGNVWGGYTSEGWTHKEDNYETDYGESVYDDKSFLFVIRSRDNYPPRIFNVVEPKVCVMDWM